MPDHDAVLDITFEAVPQPANVEEDMRQLKQNLNRRQQRNLLIREKQRE